MATSAEIKSNNNTLIRLKTAPKSITKVVIADQMDAIVDYVDQQTFAKFVKRTLTHSELLNLASNPIVLLSSVTNKLYIPSRIVLKYNDNGGFGNGGGDFTVKLKNDTNSNTLTSFGSDLGGGAIKEQLRFISYVTQTANDSFFNRRVEFSITSSPTIPMNNTTTITVYLLYNEITL